MAGMTACTGERTLNLKNIISEALDALARFDDDELVRIASSRSDRICEHERESSDICEIKLVTFGSSEMQLFARLLAITRANIDVIHHLRLTGTDQAEYVPGLWHPQSGAVD